MVTLSDPSLYKQIGLTSKPNDD